MNLSVTSDIVYIRFHGLAGGAAHDYTRRELEPWARHICEQAQGGRALYVYFNNDVNVRAPENAKMLMEMIGEYAVNPGIPKRGRMLRTVPPSKPRSQRLRGRAGRAPRGRVMAKNQLK